MPSESENLLRAIPPVNDLIQHSGISELIAEHGRNVVLAWVRDEIDATRKTCLVGGNGHTATDRDSMTHELIDRITSRADAAVRSQIGRVINATGVILHTGLGRAPLSQASQSALTQLAGAGNVEIDLETAERRYRGHQLQSAWETLTNAQDSLIVNNNAAATLLTLQTLCAGKEVIISRGQLIEIGGSFRLPEIFELSGAILREVGTTNRTKLSDYERAIGPETAAIMHVHPSNYRVIGFTTTPGIVELAPLAKKHNIASIDDIGSGSLVDVTQYGLPSEPTFIESIEYDADVVLGSGDKLLGGPQCGIILGKSQFVSQIRQHPLARAVRVGKLTLAALSATLDSYLRDAADVEIPTITMLAASQEELMRRANVIRDEVGDVSNLSLEVEEAMAPVGGGTLPGAELPTAVIVLEHGSHSADELAQRLRLGSIRLFCRIHQDRVLVDLRSVDCNDDSRVALAIRVVAEAPTTA